MDEILESKLLKIVGELRQQRETETSNNISIQQLSEENFELKIQIKNAEQKCFQVKEEHEKHILEQKKDYEEKVSKINQEKVKIQVEVDFLQKEMEDMKNEARMMHVEKLALEKTVNELKGHSILQSNLQNNMQDQLKQVKLIAEKLSKTSKELGTVQESLREDVNHAISLHDEVEHINSQYFQKIQELLKEYHSSKTNVTILRSKLQEASILPAQDNSFQTEELKLQIKHKHDEIVALHDILEESRLQNSRNLESLEASQKSVEEYVELLKKRTDEKEEIIKELNSLKRENAIQHDQLKKMQDELDQHISEWRLKELMKNDTSNKAVQTDHLSADVVSPFPMASLPTTTKKSPSKNKQHTYILPMKIWEDDKSSLCPYPQDCDINDTIAKDTYTGITSSTSISPRNTTAMENEESTCSLQNIPQHLAIQLCNGGRNKSDLQIHVNGQSSSFLQERLNINDDKDTELQESNTVGNNDHENEIPSSNVLHNKKLQNECSAVKNGTDEMDCIANSYSLPVSMNEFSIHGRTYNFEIQEFLAQNSRNCSKILLHSLQKFYNDMQLHNVQMSKANRTYEFEQSTNPELKLHDSSHVQIVSTICSQSNGNEFDGNFLPKSILTGNTITFPFLELPAFIKLLFSYSSKTAAVSNLIYPQKLNSNKTVISMKQAQENRNCEEVLFVASLESIDVDGDNDDNCPQPGPENDDNTYTQHSSRIQSSCESKQATNLLLPPDKNASLLLGTTQSQINSFHKTVSYTSGNNNYLLGSTSLASILSGRTKLCGIRKRPLSIFADKVWIPSLKKSNVPR